MPPRKHYLYREELLPNNEWKLASRTPCTCHIDENHWVERPEMKEKVA